MASCGRALFLYEREGSGCAASFLPGVWRVLVLLLCLAVLLAVRVSAEDVGDPPDPDYGGTADQDPAAQGQGDQDGISLQDFSNGDSYNLTTITNNTNSINTKLGNISSYVDGLEGKTDTMIVHLKNIQDALWNGSKIHSLVTGILNAVQPNGAFYTLHLNTNTHLSNIYNRLGYLRQDIQLVDSSVQAQTEAINNNHTSLMSELQSEYQGRTQQLNTQHNALLDQLDTEYKGRTQQLNQNHTSLMSELQSEYQGRTDQLDTQHTELMQQLSDIQYALDRDGYSNLAILRAHSESSFSWVPDFDSSIGYYKLKGSSISRSFLRFMLSGAPFLNVKNGLEFYISMIVPDSSSVSFDSLSVPYLSINDPLLASPYNNILGGFSLVYTSPNVTSLGRFILLRISFSSQQLSSLPFLPSDFQLGFPVNSYVPGIYMRIWVGEIGGSISDVTAALNRIQVETDSNMQQSVNHGQAAATDQLQSEIDKSEAFESQIFEDVNTYTKQLDFGLSDWGEAASGISYISLVFMMIWNGSPKQPIILSLMIGLCMLLLGRGARLAGEARRSQERSERRTRGS